MLALALAGLGGIALGLVELMNTFRGRQLLAIRTSGAREYLLVSAFAAVVAYLVFQPLIVSPEAFNEGLRAFILGFSFPVLLRQGVGYRATLEASPRRDDASIALGAGGPDEEDGTPSRAFQAFVELAETYYKRIDGEIAVLRQEMAHELAKALGPERLERLVRDSLKAKGIDPSMIAPGPLAPIDLALLYTEQFGYSSARKKLKAAQVGFVRDGSDAPALDGPVRDDSVPVPTNLRSLTSLALSELHEITGTDYCQVYLDDREEDVLVCVGACNGEGKTTYPELTYDGLIGVALFTGTVQNVPDVSAAEKYFLASPDTVSELAVPIPSPAGPFIGVLNAESDRPDAFSSETESRVRNLAEWFGSHAEWDPSAPDRSLERVDLRPNTNGQ